MRMNQIEEGLFPITTGSPGIGIYTPQTLTISQFNLITTLVLEQVSTWQLNVQMDDTDSVFSVNSTESFTFNFDLSCSYDGSISITYSMVQYGNELVPNWVTFDSAGGLISGVSPEVLVNTSFSFYINSEWTDTLNGKVPKLITINVIEKTENEIESEVAVVVSQASFGVVSSVAIVSSVVSGTPSPSLWSFIQQQQIIIMLFLIDPFLPESLLEYMKGIGFVFMSKSLYY